MIPYATSNQFRELDKRVAAIEEGGGSGGILTRKNCVFQTYGTLIEGVEGYTEGVVTTLNEGEESIFYMKKEDIEYIVNECPLFIAIGNAETGSLDGPICGAHIIHMIEYFGDEWKSVNYAYADTYELKYCGTENFNFWYDYEEGIYHIDMLEANLEEE